MVVVVVGGSPPPRPGPPLSSSSSSEVFGVLSGWEGHRWRWLSSMMWLVVVGRPPPPPPPSGMRVYPRMVMVRSPELLQGMRRFSSILDPMWRRMWRMRGIPWSSRGRLLLGPYVLRLQFSRLSQINYPTYPFAQTPPPGSFRDLKVRRTSGGRTREMGGVGG